jgi:hypothetical protein
VPSRLSPVNQQPVRLACRHAALIRRKHGRRFTQHIARHGVMNRSRTAWVTNEHCLHRGSPVLVPNQIVAALVMPSFIRALPHASDGSSWATSRIHLRSLPPMVVYYPTNTGLGPCEHLRRRPVSRPRRLRDKHPENPKQIMLPAAFLRRGGDVRNWMKVSINSSTLLSFS